MTSAYKKNKNEWKESILIGCDTIRTYFSYMYGAYQQILNSILILTWESSSMNSSAVYQYKHICHPIQFSAKWFFFNFRFYDDSCNISHFRFHWWILKIVRKKTKTLTIICQIHFSCLLLNQHWYQKRLKDIIKNTKIGFLLETLSSNRYFRLKWIRCNLIHARIVGNSIIKIRWMKIALANQHQKSIRTTHSNIIIFSIFFSKVFIFTINFYF